MEELLYIPVFMGLAAMGYINNKTQINNDLNTNPNNPSMTNIYNSTYTGEVKKNEEELAKVLKEFL